MNERRYQPPRGRFEVFEGHGHFEVPLGDATLDSEWIAGCNKWLADENLRQNTYSLLLQSQAWYKPVRGTRQWDVDIPMVFRRTEDAEPCQITGIVSLAVEVLAEEYDLIRVPALVLIQAKVVRDPLLNDVIESGDILALSLEELPALLELNRVPSYGVD